MNFVLVKLKQTQEESLHIIDDLKKGDEHLVDSVILGCTEIGITRSKSRILRYLTRLFYM